MVQRCQQEVPRKDYESQLFEVVPVEYQRQPNGNDRPGAYGEEGSRWPGYPLSGDAYENLVEAKSQGSTEGKDYP